MLSRPCCCEKACSPWQHSVILIAQDSILSLSHALQVSLVLPALQDSLGMGATYSLFGAISVVALATMYFTVPETKNKSLEQITAMMDAGKMK